MSRTVKWILGAMVLGVLMVANPVSFVLTGTVVSTADAIVGRPATPVSVAGVARRTTRRCVAGVPPC